jgi:hypothetical protein
MHPMFKELFLDTGADDQAADQDQRRRVRRAQRARPAMIVKPAAPTGTAGRGRDRRPAA